MLMFLAATNRWPGWQDGIELLSAIDVKDSYEPIALAAPAFPAGSIAGHQAQRLAFPYFAGYLAKLSGLPAPVIFWVLVIAMQAGILFLFLRTSAQLGAGANRRLLAFGLLALQPYFLRYYWIVPGMGADVLFEMGTMLLLASLVSGRMLGIALATLGRQTPIMLFPGILLYLWRGEGWGRNSGKTKLFSSVWGVGVFGLTFLLTAQMASRFSSGGMPLSTMYGLFPWLLEHGTAASFAEHFLRCLLPLLPVLLLLALERPLRWSADTWAFFLMGAAVAAQPFLAGPVLTGQNAARLSTLALLPLVIAWASASKRDWSSKSTGAALFLLALGSFHHLYTSLGAPSAGITALLQLAVALGVFVLAILEERRLSS